MCLMTTSVEAMPRRPCFQKSAWKGWGSAGEWQAVKSHINPFDISFFSYRHFGGWLVLITGPVVADCYAATGSRLSSQDL